MDTKDFLVEIGCEELPPKALLKLSHAFGLGLKENLERSGLQFANIQLYASPRRLACLVRDLQTQQADQTIERRGPALAAAFDEQGKPTPACEGFARSCGVTVSELERIKTDKGEWLYFKKEQAGLETKLLLPEIVDLSLKKLPIPRPMRWGSHTTQFIRPVHWLVMLLGSDVVKGEILGLKAGQVTFGHRFHHPESITITKPSDYASILAARGHVLADFTERRDSIRASVMEAANGEGGQALIDEDLLDEVTSLVEWPVALLAHFDENFLEVPQEALITAMQHHQKSFPIQDAKGNLQPRFVTVSNIESKNKNEVIHGNERVMRARLADAAFFYHTDCHTTLSDRRESLKGVVFQSKLGSLYDKTERLANLSDYLADAFHVDSKQAKQVGELSKCDLMTDMVGEFPELQGTMAYHYALNDKLPEDSAIALKEQYRPRSAMDDCPSTPLGSVLALAERLDTLVGIFGINQAPTGVKDPFALRRAAQGIFRILIKSQSNLDIVQLIEKTANNYQVNLPNQNVVKEIHKFIIERMRAWYQDKGTPPDVFNSVLARQDTQVFDFDNRIKAVKQFRTLNEAEALAAANKRVSKILKKEGKDIQANGFKTDFLQEAAEKNLAQAVDEKLQIVTPLYEKANYTEALTELASLRQPIDTFFDDVMVMVEDKELRNNRLALLAKLRNLFLQVADLSLLQ